MTFIQKNETIAMVEGDKVEGGRNPFTNALTGAAIGGLLTGNYRGAGAGALVGALLGGKPKKSRSRKANTKKRKSKSKSPKRYDNNDPFTWSLSKRLKHFHRPSPFQSANANCGKISRGHDQNLWKSTRNKNGICTWKKL